MFRPLAAVVSSAIVSFGLAAVSMLGTGVAIADDPETKAESPPAKTLDSWDAIYVSGAKVGYTRTYIEPVKDKGRELLRVRVDTELNFKRLNDFVTTRFQYGTIEQLDGTVLRLDTRTQAGEQEQRVHGDVIDGKMRLIFDGTGQRQEQVIDWPAETRGPYAVEQSLSRSMMKPGEERSLKMFMPELNRICELKLKAAAMENVKLGGNVTRTLLRVDQTATLDGKARPEFDNSFWLDSRGGVLTSKTESAGGIVTYRTTEEGAKSGIYAGNSFDQISNSVIKIKRKLTSPEQTRDIRYRVALKTENPADVFPEDRRQSITKGATANEAILEVKTAGIDDGPAGPETVGDEFLRPNAMITSEDSRVVELSRKAVGSEVDPWRKAVAIEKWVAENLKDKNFAVAFASASEVAKNLEGDCTEHAVLTGAMCRAAGVPSRVVTGLIYASDLNGFGFHMWNEVYVNRRWVAIDASFNQQDVDAVHLKLSDTSLDGISPFESFLPIARVMGKLTIDPLEVKRAR